MAGNLTARACVIVDAPEVIAVWHRRKGAVERQDLETVTRQIELANDLWTQQGDHVRTNRKLEAGKNFFSDGSAAQNVTTLEHEHLFAGACEICSIHQTVMSAANHDDVVFLRHAFVRVAS